MSGEQLEPGTLLNERYRILRVIGKGGMGTVYQAEHTRLDTILAVKEVRAPQTTDVDAQSLLEQCEHEARFLVRLHHPNLPQVTDAFLENDRFFVVMEYIEGVTLEARQRLAGPEGIPAATVIEWGLQIADVLSYLHSQDPPVIFRDLKPANVMVESSGRIRLIDFGIARRFQPGAVKDTNLLGSVGYSPPEQFGRHQTDTRTDIYAFGATLHNLLTGRDPSHAPFKFTPARTLNPTVPEALSRLIDYCLRLDADARPQSMHEVAMDLLTIRDTLPPPVEQSGIVAAGATLNAEPIVRPSPTGSATSTGPNIILTNTALRNTGRAQHGSQRTASGSTGSDRLARTASGTTDRGPASGVPLSNGAGAPPMEMSPAPSRQLRGAQVAVGVVCLSAVIGLGVWMAQANARHPQPGPGGAVIGVQTPAPSTSTVDPGPAHTSPSTGPAAPSTPSTPTVTPSDTGAAPTMTQSRMVTFESIDVKGVSQDPQGHTSLQVQIKGVAEGQAGDQDMIAAFFYDGQNNQIVSQLPQSPYSSRDGKLSVATVLNLASTHYPFDILLSLPLSAFPATLTGTIQFHCVAFFGDMRIGESKTYVPIEATMLAPTSATPQNQGAPTPDSGTGAPSNTTTKPPESSGDNTGATTPAKRPGTISSSPLRPE